MNLRSLFDKRRSDAELLEELRGIIEATVLGTRVEPSSCGCRDDLEQLQERVAAISEGLADENRATAHRLEDFGAELDRQRTALAHGIEHEERRERRIEGTVRRARKKLAELGYEEPGLEAEFDGLSLVDGSGSDEGELRSVRDEMEEGARVAASSVRGVSREQLQRARGF